MNIYLYFPEMTESHSKMVKLRLSDRLVMTQIQKKTSLQAQLGRVHTVTLPCTFTKCGVSNIC